MFNSKIYIFLTFIFLECLFKNLSILHKNTFKYSSNFIVNAKPLENEPISAIPFKKEDINQAEVFIAELSDDISTRLHQILNNEIYYHPVIDGNVNNNDDDDDNSGNNDDEKSNEIVKRKNEILVNNNEITDNQEEINEILIKNNIKITNNSKENHNEEKIDEILIKNTNTYNKNADIQYNTNSYINKNNYYKNNSIHNNSSSIEKRRSNDNGDNDNKNNKSSSILSNSSPSSTNNSKSNTNINTSSNSKNSKVKTNSLGNSTESIMINKQTKFSFYHTIEINEEDLINQDSSEILMNTEKPFDFSISCMDDTEECLYINNKLENAGNLIANVFNIYETIKVDVHILPFCKHMVSDNCESITALTYPPSFVTLNITNQGIYSYPQALIKQFNIKDRVKNLASYDISLYFNTDYLKKNNFGNYFLVVTHEIIHGMGFFHLMTTASSAFKMTFPEDRIIPQPIVNNYRTSKGVEKAYQGWIPFTVFDRYIVEVNHPNYYIHKGLQDYLEDVQVHKLRSEEEVIQHFENLDIPPPNSDYSKHLVQSFTTREAIGFKTYDGEVVTLQTFKEYEPMSSISHIHAPFSCDSSINCFVPKEKLKEVDENYLMYYTIITRPVNELVNRFSNQSSHGVIGEKIVKIMKTLGWTEKTDLTYFKEYQSLILNREAKSSTSAASSQILTNHSIYLTIFSSFLTIFIIYFLSS